MPAPGVAQLENETCYLPLGEPDGSDAPRVTALSRAMSEAGLKAPVKRDIRAELWTKMINSLTWNPIAVLTLASNGEIGRSPGTVEIARRMMTEAEAVAARFGAAMATPKDKRIAFTVGLTHHKMSMLIDLEAGKPLEIAGRCDGRSRRDCGCRHTDRRHDACAPEAAGSEAVESCWERLWRAVLPAVR